MSLNELRERVTVVLVRARNPNNIGAVARAMHDFGFSDLRVVNEYGVPLETAKSAVDASKVIAAAKVCGSVAEAVADCTLVMGTSAVGERALEHRLYAIAEAAELVRAETAKANGRVALLFGSEKTGLSNDELSHCHCLVTIPMYEHEDARHPSMNLGQAAAVCLYELARTTGVHEGVGAREAATAGDLERLTELMMEMMESTGYSRRHPANAREEEVRRLVRRMSLSAEDVPMWMGIMRQVLRASTKD